MKPRTAKQSYELKHLLNPKISESNLFHVEIRFGNPKAECRNFGICKIEEVPKDKEITQLGDRKCRATIEFFGKTHWRISFLRESMSKNLTESFFDRKIFIVEDDYKVILNNCKSIIKKGKYLIYKTEHRFLISKNKKY